LADQTAVPLNLLDSPPYCAWTYKFNEFAGFPCPRDVFGDPNKFSHGCVVDYLISARAGFTLPNGIGWYFTTPGDMVDGFSGNPVQNWPWEYLRDSIGLPYGPGGCYGYLSPDDFDCNGPNTFNLTYLPGLGFKWAGINWLSGPGSITVNPA
jgi:hypothetical protein